MNLLEVIKKRYSVRNYLPDEISRDKLDYVLESVRFAPSAANIQPWKFFIVKDEETRCKLFEAYPRPWFSTDPAPVIVVACADTDKSWKRSYDGTDYAFVDVAIAFEHLCLAAAEQELGTCWIAHFIPEKVTEALNLPPHLVPVAMTPLGYPGPDNGKRTSRKPVSDIIGII